MEKRGNKKINKHGSHNVLQPTNKIHNIPLVNIQVHLYLKVFNDTVDWAEFLIYSHLMH